MTVQLLVIIGEIIGNQNSKSYGGKQMRCTKHTKYEEYGNNILSFNCYLLV